MGDETDAAFYAARYDGELRYVDDQLARLLAALEARGLDEDTLVVVTSDHGEDMGEHGVWFSHGWTLFDPALHVPLVLALPGGLPEGRRYEDLVQSVDVLPTVLALLGREHGAPTQGRDLRALLAG
ncbi:MAG: sulfatase-like hydrolase/transferase, partial [Myxococcales bacterium]|nr:sulfatase-like hydrolase/transferase [Myxococcales bacterium]